MKRILAKLGASRKSARNQDRLSDSWKQSLRGSEFSGLEVAEGNEKHGENSDSRQLYEEFRQHVDRLVQVQKSARYNRKKRRGNWIATCFSLMWPGFGHLYQRRWLEAMFWMSLALGVVFCAVGLTSMIEVGWLSLVVVGGIAAVGNFKSSSE